MSGGANTVTLAQLPSTSSGSGASDSSDDHSDLPSISSSGSGASEPSVDHQFELPPSTSNVSRASVVLHEICPSASSSEIQVALSAAGGNVDEAAQTLLGEKIYHEQLTLTLYVPPTPCLANKTGHRNELVSNQVAPWQPIYQQLYLCFFVSLYFFFRDPRSSIN